MRQFPPDKCATRLRYTPTVREAYRNWAFEARGNFVTTENELKTSTAVGPLVTETPTENPAQVQPLSFDREAFLKRELPSFTPGNIVPSWVYVMRCERFVKIGISSDVAKRHRGLQGAVPLLVTMANKYTFADRQYAWLAEQECHALLSDYRTFGEWFEVPYELAIGTVRQVVPAARRLMEIHRQRREEEERERIRQIKADPLRRAQYDAAIARNDRWSDMDAARSRAMADAAAAVEQVFRENELLTEPVPALS